MSVYEGRIEAVAERLMTGWVRTADPQDEFLIIEFSADGQELGRALAQADPSTSDLRYNFGFLLPKHLEDGAGHQISARIGDETVALENSAHFLTPPLPRPPLTGFLDAITKDANIVGWAWYPEDPKLRAELEVLADHQLVGTLEASTHRPDLLKAGIGDGNYGFTWPLPLSVLATPRNVLISVRDKNTGKILPQPITFEQPTIVDALTKISLLEADVHLLRGALAALTDQPRQESLAARDLFDIVGKFFLRLGEVQAAPGGLREIRPVADALDAVTASFTAFALPSSATPLVSVFIGDAANAAGIYASLHAVGTALADVPAEIFLLDTGLCADAPLLPLVAQNLRYAQLQGSDTARLNAAMRLAAGSVVFYRASGQPPPPRLAETLQRFSRSTTQAILAGPALRPDGLNSTAPANCFALHHATWKMLDGLDERLPGLAAALAELAARHQATTAAHATLTFAPTPAQKDAPNES